MDMLHHVATLGFECPVGSQLTDDKLVESLRECYNLLRRHFTPLDASQNTTPAAPQAEAPEPNASEPNQREEGLNKQGSQQTCQEVAPKEEVHEEDAGVRKALDLLQSMGFRKEELLPYLQACAGDVNATVELFLRNDRST